MRTARVLMQLDSGSSCVSFRRNEGNGYKSKNDGHEQPCDRDPYSEHPDDREEKYPSHERRSQYASNLRNYLRKALQHRCSSSSIASAQFSCASPAASDFPVSAAATIPTILSHPCLRF